MTNTAFIGFYTRMSGSNRIQLKAEIKSQMSLYLITTIQHSGCSIRIMLEGRQFLFQWCFYIWKATTSQENFI